MTPNKTLEFCKLGTNWSSDDVEASRPGPEWSLVQILQWGAECCAIWQRREKRGHEALRVALWAMEQITDSYKSGEILSIDGIMCNLETDGEYVWDLSGNESAPPVGKWRRPVLDGTDTPDPNADDQWVIGVDELNEEWRAVLKFLRTKAEADSGEEI